MLSPETEATIEAFYKSTVPEVVDSFVDQVTRAAVKGADVPQTVLNNMAYMAGKTPEELKGDLAGITEAFSEQASEYIASIDPEIDPAEFYEYITTEVDPHVVQALFRDQFRGKLDGYKNLVQAYRNSFIPGETVERLQAEGYEFFTQDRHVMVRTPEGKQYEAKVARRMGVI